MLKTKLKRTILREFPNCQCMAVSNTTIKASHVKVLGWLETNEEEEEEEKEEEEERIR